MMMDGDDGGCMPHAKAFAPRVVADMGGKSYPKTMSDKNRGHAGVSKTKGGQMPQRFPFGAPDSVNHGPHRNGGR